jgi:hypothetical protein
VDETKIASDGTGYRLEPTGADPRASFPPTGGGGGGTGVVAEVDVDVEDDADVDAEVGGSELGTGFVGRAGLPIWVNFLLTRLAIRNVVAGDVLEVSALMLTAPAPVTRVRDESL